MVVICGYYLWVFIICVKDLWMEYLVIRKKKNKLLWVNITNFMNDKFCGKILAEYEKCDHKSIKSVGTEL